MLDILQPSFKTEMSHCHSERTSLEVPKKAFWELLTRFLQNDNETLLL